MCERKVIMDNQLRDTIFKAYIVLGQTNGVFIEELIGDEGKLKATLSFAKDELETLTLNANEPSK